MAVGVSPTVKRIAMAIAIAERGSAEIDSGSVANNNPGDIMSDGSMIVYPTLDAGWNALYNQVGLFLSGGSGTRYSPDMSISQIAQTYVGTSDWPNWATNVANYLGVSTDTPIGSV